MNYTYLKNQNLILFEVISGSQAYGTSVPESDVDKKFIYVLPKNYIYGTKYIEQINENKDFTGYEIKRFLELLSVNNPTIIELIGTYPEECVIYKHPIFDLILQNRDKFITKQCRNSFVGYARQQINKSNGLNKKQNWEAERISRKTPLDFCYAVVSEQSIPLKKYLKSKKLDPKFCGLSKVNHSKDLYSLFYDVDAAYCFSELYHNQSRKKNLERRKKLNLKCGFGYHGIEVDTSNFIRLSSIPKGQLSICNIIFNSDSYQMHCKDFKSYQDWLKNRNITRYTSFKSHGQGLDGKNMMHCKRLIDMSKEIASGKGINVRRENAFELLKIRKGEISLSDLITNSEQQIQEIDILFNNCNLPDDVDKEFVHDLLVQIRTELYSFT